MTASRTCRACGAELQGYVMWCLRCYEPVRQLTPRESQLAPARTVTTPRVERPRSRWKAGATTFGPIGRIAITIVVLLFIPTSLDPISLFVYWPCYLALAFVILRSTWSNDFIDLPGAGEDQQDEAQRDGMLRLAPAETVSPPVRTPIPRSTVIAWIMLAVLGGVLGLAGLVWGDVGRGVIGIGASITALVLWIVWIARG